MSQLGNMPEEEWNYDTTIKFIRLLHARPIIWKKDFKDYFNPSAREAAIAEIAEGMNTVPALIKEKIKRMTDQCYQEEIRMQTSNDHMPRWNFFHQFRFVLKAEHADVCMKREIVEVAELEVDRINEMLWVEDVEKSFYEESDTMELLSSNDGSQELENKYDDEFAALGKEIANELRKLEKNPNLQTKLKNELTLAMLDAIEDVANQKFRE